MTGKRRTISLSARTADIYAEAAEKLGIMISRGGGEPRPNVSGLLGLIATLIADGTFDLSAYRVMPRQLVRR